MSSLIRKERLDVRISVEDKELVLKAAELSGSSLSSFLRMTILRSARKLIEQSQMINLSNRDRDRFLEAMANPPEPNENVRRAVKQYKKQVVS